MISPRKCDSRFAGFGFLLLALASLGTMRPAAAHDSETASTESCDSCCGDNTANIFPDPDEKTPGQPECTAPTGPLECVDGYGAIGYSSPVASYVSATFDRVNYSNPPAVGTWNFNIPALGYVTASNTYNVRFDANTFRSFLPSGGTWKGQFDNVFSLIARSPSGFAGKAVMYDRSGRMFIFSDPNPGSGPTSIEKIKEVGGSYRTFQYFNPSTKLSHIWFWSSVNASYTRLWIYSAWQTLYGFPIGPATIDEYVAKTNVPSPNFNSADWAKKKTYTFTYYTGQVGYQDANYGNLIAIDESTYLSNGTDTSVARTVFKYHLSGSQTGNQSQLRAVIGPDSYRDFIVTEPGVTSTTVFTSTLSALRGEPGGFSKNYLDEEFEYNLSSPPTSIALRLSKRTVRNKAGTCGCAGSAGGVFTYSYLTNSPPPPTLNQWLVQVKIEKGSPPVTYAYYEYNPYAKRLVEAMVDPADLTESRKHVRWWQYDTTSGLLSAKYLPSACTGTCEPIVAGYDPLSHTVTPNGCDGLVYWYAPAADNSTVTEIRVSKGSTGTKTLIVALSYTRKPDPLDSNRSRYFLASRTEYQPSAEVTYYDQQAFHTGDALALKKQKITLPIVRSFSPDQNGSGAVGEEFEYYDQLGRRTWFKDAAGAVHVTTYYQYTNAVTSQIVDVNTAAYPPPENDPDFNQTYPRDSASPPGDTISWPDLGVPQHLQTVYDLDSVGRVTKVTEPHGRTRYFYHTRLSKGQYVALEFPHLTTAGNAVGALKIRLSYQGGPERDVAEAQLAATVTSQNYTGIWNPNANTIVDALGANGSLLSRTSFVYEKGHLTKFRRYIDALIDSPVGNTYETTYAYDDRGNRNRMQDPPDGAQAGTITGYTYDFLRRLESVSIGTNDQAPGGNMVEVERRYYDGATGSEPGLGDGNLTQLVEHVDSNPANDRITTYVYEYAQLGKLTKAKSPTGIVTKRSYSTQGWLTDEQTYIGSDVATNLRAWSRYLYDSRGQVYESRTLGVDPANPPTDPNSTDYVSVRYWRSQRGEVLKVQENGGILRKSQFDGLGRLVRSTVSWDSAEAGYAAATDLTLSGDTVLEQAETLYDGGGNPNILKRLDREPAYGGSGVLAHGSPTQARGNYVAIWYDVEDRETQRANYGNHCNTDLAARPSPVPTSSNTTDPDCLKRELLSQATYLADGKVASITDPQAIVTTYSYDDPGRLIEEVENSTGTDIWKNRKTQYSYTPSDQVKTITAATAGADPATPVPQVTTYIYGVDPSQEGGQASTITSNRLVYQIEYPQDDSQLERETLGYNRQAETTYKKDIVGIVHKYGYTLEASRSSDVVDNDPGTFGFSNSVRSIWRTYDSLGRLESVTSYSDKTQASTARNGVLVSYDKYWQAKEIFQNVNGAATTSSPKVSFTFNYPVSGGVPGLRRTATTYPNGLVINDNYTTTTDNYLSRQTGRSVSGGSTLFSNTYLGADRVTKRQHPGPQVDWEVTLDAFARAQNLTVKYVPYGYYHNSYEYGYNFNSQVTYRKELTTSGQSEQYVYNGLSMLDQFRRGVHSTDGSISDQNLTYGQLWTYTTVPPSLDHSGNWRKYLITTDSPTTPYTRDFNKSNELTAIHPPSGSQVNLTYDANGNTAAYGNLQYKYDAWNRLVEAWSGPILLLALEYNGLGQKILKTEYLGQNKAYFYNADYQVLQEYNWDSVNRLLGSSLYSYVWGTQYIDELVARRNEAQYGTLEYYMQDANFNTIARINSSGSVINRYTYTAYGVPTQLTSSWTTGSAITEDLYLYTGREYHQIAGIYDYRSRLYYPSLGRFLNRDILGIWTESDGNGYNYVSNDPHDKSDPTGFGGKGKAAGALIDLGVRGFKKIKKLWSDKDLVRALRDSEDIICSRKAASEAWRRAGGGEPVHHRAHRSAGEGARNHCHHKAYERDPDAPTNHAFYGLSGGLTLSYWMQNTNPVSEGLAEIVDFFNPLSLPNDVEMIYDSLTSPEQTTGPVAFSGRPDLGRRPGGAAGRRGGGNSGTTVGRTVKCSIYSKCETLGWIDVNELSDCDQYCMYRCGISLVCNTGQEFPISEISIKVFTCGGLDSCSDFEGVVTGGLACSGAR